MSEAANQQRPNLYTSTSDVDYVPLNHYPQNAAYQHTDGPKPMNPTMAAALAPMTRERWNLVRFRIPPGRRMAAWAGIFLAIAVALAAVSFATPKMYKRTFWTEPSDSVSLKLGYTVEVKEKIGVLNVCYKIKTTPIARNKTGTESVSKHCTSFANAFSDTDYSNRKSASRGMNVGGKHTHVPELDRRRGGPVFCYAKTMKISFIVSFALFGAVLAICVLRRFATQPRTHKAGAILHPVPILASFLALSCSALSAALGTRVFSDQAPPPDFFDSLQGQVSPFEWQGDNRHSFSMSCGFTILVVSWLCMGFSLLLSVVHSSREVERFETSGTLDPPLLAHH